MPIRVVCSCGQQFAAKDELAGKRVKCPKCQAVLTIPAAGAPAAASGKALSSLLDDAGMRAGVRRCPGCGAELAEAAVLCVLCGYDTRRGHRLKTRIGGEVEVEDDELGELVSHGHPMLDAAERQIALDKLAQKRLATGAPWWMLLLAFLGLVGFAVGMVSMPQESVMENSGLALQVGGGALAGIYFLRLIISAFMESLLLGLVCVVAAPIYVVMRWDRVVGLVIYIGVGIALFALGIGLVNLAPMFKGSGDAVSQVLGALVSARAV